MKLLRTFLRPGWIALGIVVIAFAAACFWVLAPWQLGKNSATSERNSLLKSAMSTAAVPLDSLAPAGRPFSPHTEWREVTMRGHYLPDKEVMVRLRSVNDQPAVEVLTPFVTDNGARVVLVDRGYVRPQQGTVPVIPPAPTTDTTISARIRASEGTTAGRGAHLEAGRPAVYTIDPMEVGKTIHTSLDPFYLQLSPSQAGSLGEIPLPQLASGPYLSYGLQWLAFGIMAPLGAGYFIYSEVRQRRRGATRATPATDAATEQSQPATDSASTIETHRSRRRRIRADLQEAGTASGSRQRIQIGTGPGADDTPETVRAKLSERYGG